MATDPNTRPLVGRPMLSLKSASEVEAEQRKELKSTQVESEDALTGLIGFVTRAFETAREAKQNSGADDLLLDSLRRRRGEYSAEKLSQIKRQNEPDIFVPLTETKCNAAEAWMGDVLAPHGDKIWALEPTPVPELSESIKQQVVNKALEDAQLELMATGQPPSPEAIQGMVEGLQSELLTRQSEEARMRAGRMSKLIEDQLAESNWGLVFKDFLSHLVTFGTGILKGPVVRNRENLVWDQGDTPVVKASQTPHAESVSPLDFFPSPHASEVEDGYMIERCRLSRTQLHGLKNLPHYRVDEITELLEGSPYGHLEEDEYTDDERQDLEGKDDICDNPDRLLTVYEYWGPVPGEHLKDWGVSSAEAGIDYEFQVLWSGRHILKVMSNPDPLKRRPYHKATFKRTVGSFWGRGVPQLMLGSQDRANAAIRSLVVNMGMSSGPQVLVDVDRIARGEKLTEAFPRKVWQVTNEYNLNAKPIDFVDVNSHVAELQAVYDRAVQDADTESGVPAFSYGSDQASGAARTVGGLSILMNSAARGIKEAFSDIDQRAIRPLITRFYVWNMLYTDDPEIKGDLQVIARGASGMLLKELQTQKLTEFMDRTNNPTDMQIIGIEGRAEMLRQQLKLLNMRGYNIVPSAEEMAKRVEQARREQMITAQLQDSQQGPGENSMGTAPRQEEL